MDREIQVYVIYTNVFFNKELSTTDQGLPLTAVQQCINERVCSFYEQGPHSAGHQEDSTLY
jgi:hypothetical protein